MLCAISGEAPQVPVASRKTGNVFERRLIEAYISQNGTDPVTGDELTVEDLIELKTARIVRPRPPALTSIPSLLSTFQNEWDAIALETYTLKQQLAQTRQELSTMLYQHEAAERVIARLAKERDEARESLSHVTTRGDRAFGNGDAMLVDCKGVPESISAKIDETQDKLSSSRRKRPVPEGWGTEDCLKTLHVTHSSDAICPGGKCLAIDKECNVALICGGEDSAAVYSLKDAKITQVYKVGSSVTDGLWCGSLAIIVTAAGLVHIYDGKTEMASKFSSHAGTVTAVALHATGDILATSGIDKAIILHDLTNMRSIAQFHTNSELTCCQFHPDGHLVAAGAKDGQIKLYEVKSGENAANFEDDGPLQAICFSENGIWLASTVNGSSSVSIWDLRKSSRIKNLDIGSVIQSIKWDYTGQFLVAAGETCIAVECYSKSSKTWSEPFRKIVSASIVEWGSQARSVVALTGEGTITVLSVQ